MRRVEVREYFATALQIVIIIIVDVCVCVYVPTSSRIRGTVDYKLRRHSKCMLAMENGEYDRSHIIIRHWDGRKKLTHCEHSGALIDQTSAHFLSHVLDPR